MNKKLVIASAFFITLMAVGMISCAAAQYDYNPTIHVIPGKWIVTWWFQTYDPWLDLHFDGRTIDRSSVVAYAQPPGGVYTPVKPFFVLITKDYVFLFFWNKTLPKESTLSAVSGALTTTTCDTFDATGPGWLWSNPG
jgi:hypothetical protein